MNSVVVLLRTGPYLEGGGQQGAVAKGG